MARPKTPLIDRRKVAETALRMIDRQGIDGLSLRELAAELGVNAASLYHHFADKDEIIDAATRLALIEGFQTPIDREQPWQEQLVDLSVGAYQKLCEHPNLIPLLTLRADRRFPSHHYVMRLLRSNGFPEDLVVAMMDTTGGYLIGMAIRFAHEERAVSYDADALVSAPGDARIDPLEQFEIGLRGLIVAWQHAAATRRPTRRRRTTDTKQAASA
jgi:AcrR family transcriptional regulator